jgi:flagella basal body P-ring formation protein FlgA
MVVALVPAMLAAAALPTAQSRHDIAAGAFVRAGDFVAARCTTGGRPALRYEPQLRATRALRAIAAGECVPSNIVATLPAIAPGQRVTAITGEGAVTVERTVEALEAAGPGQRLLVRAADAAPYSVRFEEVKP